MGRTAGGCCSVWSAGVALLLFQPLAPWAAAQTLPADAQAVIADYQKAVAEIQKQADEQIKAKNEEAKAKLEKLQTAYTQAGKLDEAVALRDLIRNYAFLRELKAEADPGTLSAFRSQKGDVLFFEVVGSSTGSIWGTGMYTHDSHLATAAVHAGVLKAGQKGIVKVTILPAQTNFIASGQNGVSSSAWTSFSYDCYKVESAKPSDALLGKEKGKPTAHTDVRPDPGNLQGYRDQVGQSFLFEVTGKGSSVYGSEFYTDDSLLATAALHAGLVVEGKTAVVKVTILGPQDKFESITRNGITSSSWGAWGGSYKVEAAPKDVKK